MKKAIFIICGCMIIACTKSKNTGSQSSTSDPIITNGCATCSTVAREPDGTLLWGGGPGTDTTLCNVNDSILNAYIKANTYKGPMPGNASITEIITTTCN